jgi:nascent polypeptide-associated complex subunit alpha
MMRRGKVNPREANRMMQRMGMQVQQLDEVTKVIMESPTKRIIIDNPEVATVTVQGQTIYQVGGGTVREEGVGGGGSDDDVKLVASQAGVSTEQAANALRQSNGDLAQAIILLKQKRAP